MQMSSEGAKQSMPPAGVVSSHKNPANLLLVVQECLDDGKAEEIVTIDLSGKSSMADYMVVATGRSHRHVGAVADQLARKLREIGHGRARVEGKDGCDWVLVDAGDIIIHVFRQEVREFYNLEKMWLAERPADILPV